MTRRYFCQESILNATVETVFAWHEHPDAFTYLKPPWVKLKGIETTGVIPQLGSTVKLTQCLWGPITPSWYLEHTAYEKNKVFVDTQRSGPFAFWEHRHGFSPTPDGLGCIMRDEIWYQLYGAPLVDWVYAPWIAGELDRLFAFRHRVLCDTFGVR